MEGSIPLCPLLQFQEEGLVFSTLPHCSVWLSGRGSYWSPLPLLSSPDFFALNGVLHYTCCLLMVLSSSRVKLHAWGLILQSAFCRVAYFAVALQIVHNYDPTCTRSLKMCFPVALCSYASLNCFDAVKLHSFLYFYCGYARQNNSPTSSGTHSLDTFWPFYNCLF